MNDREIKNKTDEYPLLCEMITFLCSEEEKRLRKQYPDEDGWRPPRNIGESMGCVGYAMFLLKHYEEKLRRMPDDEIRKMYKLVRPDTSEEEASDKKNTDPLFAAKKMFFEYECSEYNMKLDDVLEKYSAYHVPSDIQRGWKNEYISDLFKKLEKDGDIADFIKLSAFSRMETNADIFKRLYHYFIRYNHDAEFGTKMIFSLTNAVNRFSAKYAGVKKILEDLCLYLETIISDHGSDTVVKRAVKHREVLTDLIKATHSSCEIPKIIKDPYFQKKLEIIDTRREVSGYGMGALRISTRLYRSADTGVFCIIQHDSNGGTYWKYLPIPENCTDLYEYCKEHANEFSRWESGFYTDIS